MSERKYVDAEHLDYVELHVVDRCNLNCNACSHFSPMVREDFDHLESFKSDINQLRLYFERINKIRLLGGEPFLDEKLDEYVVLARQLYPDSIIEVVTNGLLIPRVTDRILRTISDSGIVVTITLYPPTAKILDEIITTLNKYDLEYQVSEMVINFRRKFLPDGSSDPEKAFSECTLGRYCTFVYSGRLYLCSGAALVKYYNDVSGTDIVCKDSSIDLYNTSTEEIVRFLNQYNDSCRYCGRGSEETWSVCENLRKIDVSRWITDGGRIR